MEMETIQVEVPSELAKRLRPYREELVRILESGLRHVEREAGEQSKVAPDAVVMQRQIAEALHQAGAVGPAPEEVTQYLTGRENQRWKPIKAGGKPASELIIEERASRPWARG